MKKLSDLAVGQMIDYRRPEGVTGTKHGRRIQNAVAEYVNACNLGGPYTGIKFSTKSYGDDYGGGCWVTRIS